MPLSAPPVLADSRLSQWLQDLYAHAQTRIGNPSACFVATNIAPGVTVDIPVAGTDTQFALVLPLTADIMGIAVSANGLRIAGTAVFRPTVNGVAATELSGVLDGTNPQYARTVIRHSRLSVVAGDRIGIQVQASADWAPGTLDAVVYLIVIM